MTPRELAVQAAVMAAIANHALGQKDKCRAALSSPGMMANGERLFPADPAHPGSRLGRVNKTDPKDSARISGRAAFAAWMSEFYPERTETTWMVRPGHEKDVIEYLRRAAPGLVTSRVDVLPWAEAEVLKLTKNAGAPCGPGREADVPGVEYVPAGEGTITVTPHRDALEVIARMVREGRLDIQTGEILAIERNADGGDD